jgi:Holliday junction resolvase-like predicted endonuclease
VEVKARRHSIQAPPQENVNAQKQKKIVKAAQSYLRKGKGTGLRNKECMFDVVAVTFQEDTVTTEYFEQAFIPIFI